jgi:hypothetical protein
MTAFEYFYDLVTHGWHFNADPDLGDLKDRIEL